MRTIIKATNDNLKKIIAREIKKYGYNADLNHIDVSQVEHMEGLFRESNFNGDISKWDTSRVT